jgi:hypothetical protein
MPDSKAKAFFMRPTRQIQEKLQDVLKALDYSIRYERGNFKGGHCVIQEEKVIVINKFYPLESKINTLMEIIREVEIDDSLLSQAQLSLVKKVKESAE